MDRNKKKDNNQSQGNPSSQESKQGGGWRYENFDDLNKRLIEKHLRSQPGTRTGNCGTAGAGGSKNTSQPGR
ncbi:MAG: hypothetical protein PG981_001089 [Wolbachia endosymbiont of Ctenocephalides orientis wCori]|nr:MAG: hypothetical protein PG981_001089 [Wolbachia endosymbiont of Ctenocephalides orientis wCori]